MPSFLPHRLNQCSVMVAMISAAFAGPAQGAAARIDFSVGSVIAASTDGRQRALAKGSEIDSGDTIRTNDGRVQLRFTDGSYVSLQPNTEFSVNEYKYEGKADGNERGIFALAKGALRTVTGFIGRANRSTYRINTPTATVGIRGTGGLIQVQNDGSTLVRGSSGIWSLTNPAGTLDVPAGRSAVAPSAPGTPPQQTSQTPSAGPAPATTNSSDAPAPKQGENTTDTGKTVCTSTSEPGCDKTTTVAQQAEEKEQSSATPPQTTTPPPTTPPPNLFGTLTTGAGYAMAAAFSSIAFDGTMIGAAVSNDVSATFDGSGRLSMATGTLAASSMNLNSMTPPAVTYIDILSGTHTEANNVDGLAWGRWTGTVQVGCSNCLTDTYSANGGYHYVIGTPTAVLPTTGTATYAVMGATSPTTFATNAPAPGTFLTSSSISVAFGTTATITALFNVNANNSNYVMSGSTTTRTAIFSMSPTISGCLSACSGGINGFFAGPGAERIGAAYRIEDLNGTVLGAAAFKKQ